MPESPGIPSIESQNKNGLKAMRTAKQGRPKGKYYGQPRIVFGESIRETIANNP
jgi:hypothetical protein